VGIGLHAMLEGATHQESETGVKQPRSEQQPTPRGIAGQPPVWWLTAASLMVLASWLLPVFAGPASASPPALTPPLALQATDRADDLLLATGFVPRLEDLSVLIEAEIETLSDAGFFAPGEIEKVSAELREVKEETLYRTLHATASRQFTEAEWQQLDAWHETPAIKALLGGEMHLRSPEGKTERDSYLQTLKDRTPHPQRITLMEALSDARSRVLLETLTRIELRKNLLSAVSRAKTGKPLPESALRSELQDYDKTLRATLVAQRRDDYLFLFRHTPTQTLEALLKLHDDPLYVRFMQVATRTLRDALAAPRH
jgi:hypothetical protein